ncbi:MAG: tRNA epoxyqueuosine(34) reductase QueG [Acidimicrobiales bacterium]|nr:tRNA epoxyqueuosine(34) reductase QueG [Acidimicrobiales bacterium]
MQTTTPSRMDGLADELRRIGRQAGLDRVGICDALPFTESRQAIERRKLEGRSAGMQFTFRNPSRSTDPQVTMPGARALFVGARSYYRQAPPAGAGRERHPDPQDRPDPEGRVARYSWVDHYGPLRQALGQVAGRIEQEGWRARVLVDDNALVDRAAAVRAGLGWFGKNTNVLLPGAGSWFVLGSVLTDAPIAPPIRPAPVDDGCGSCKRCLSDCPTGALVEPGQLDARRCLAWLLQAPGVFPVEHRAALGDRLYGCDDCQVRCPVNRRAERDSPPADAEPRSQAFLSVLEVLEADDEALEALVGRWYIPGRELRFVRRNALIVLGNVGDPDHPGVLEALGRALASRDPILRSHAVWAAARLGRTDLLGGLAADTDPLVADEMARLGEQ